MKYKIYRVILPVSNIGEAQQFYGTLFGIPGVRVSPGRHYFQLGGVILACYDAKADGDALPFRPNPDHIYISCDELENLFERAKKLNCQRLDEKIEKMPWGERCFYLSDPFGNQLCMVDERTLFTGG